MNGPPPFLSDAAVTDWLGGVEDPRAVVQRWLAECGRFTAGKFLVETGDGRRIGRVGLNF